MTFEINQAGGGVGIDDAESVDIVIKTNRDFDDENHRLIEDIVREGIDQRTDGGSVAKEDLETMLTDIERDCDFIWTIERTYHGVDQ